MKKIPLLFCMALTGCSTLKVLEPDGLPIEFTHVSHISQHEPFTDHPTKYGYQLLSIGARWELFSGLNLVLEDGINLNSRSPAPFEEYGALQGPKEVFTGRISYEIPLK